MTTTLVIDTGDDIVGIFSIEDGKFVTYRGNEIALAIERITVADEVVTYNGKRYDLRELGKFAGLPDKLPLNGIHTDMRSICWSDRILGSNLRSTYRQHFAGYPNFADTHEGSVEFDVYMAFKLWELWKQGGLKVMDGHTL